MKIQINKEFLKDLIKIPNRERIKIEQFVFEECKNIDSFWSLHSAEKLSGYKNYFKVKIGKYRLGIKYELETVVFERVLHRKDIYKHFP